MNKKKVQDTLKKIRGWDDNFNKTVSACIIGS